MSLEKFESLRLHRFWVTRMLKCANNRLRGTTEGANNRMDLMSLVTSGVNDAEASGPDEDILGIVEGWQEDETHNPDVPAVSHKRGLTPFVFVPFDEVSIMQLVLMCKCFPIDLHYKNQLSFYISNWFFCFCFFFCFHFVVGCFVCRLKHLYWTCLWIRWIILFPVDGSSSIYSVNRQDWFCEKIKYYLLNYFTVCTSTCVVETRSSIPKVCYYYSSVEEIGFMIWSSFYIYIFLSNMTSYIYISRKFYSSCVGTTNITSIKFLVWYFDICS